MADGDAIWCYSQALTGELLSSPLEFWSKALSSFADTHSFLRGKKKKREREGKQNKTKQTLACYWALAENEG